MVGKKEKLFKVNSVYLFGRAGLCVAWRGVGLQGFCGISRKSFDAAA